jgi:hypothetical protein
MQSAAIRLLLSKAVIALCNVLGRPHLAHSDQTLSVSSTTASTPKFAKKPYIAGTPSSLHLIERPKQNTCDEA